MEKQIRIKNSRRKHQITCISEPLKSGPGYPGRGSGEWADSVMDLQEEGGGGFKVYWDLDQKYAVHYGLYSMQVL